MSSTRQAILCVLVILGVAGWANAQSTSTKEPVASISGKVTFKGEAVKGVIIALRAGDYPSTRKFTNYRGVTDAKGEYRITNVPPGTYGVGPASTGFVVEGEANGERTLIVNGPESVEDFDFSLSRGGVITGRVLDSDGLPVIEEEIYIFSPRDPGIGSLRPATVTDDRGIYRVFGLRPGSYVVAAARDDGARSGGRPRPVLYGRTYYPGVTDAAQAKVIEVSDGSETTDVNVTFTRPLTTYTANGRIVNGDTGQPVPEATYGLMRVVGRDQYMSGWKGRTNNQGEFKLENLVPGQYAVAVSPQADRDWRAEPVRFEIVDQDVTGIVVRTIKGGSLSGVVVLDGTYDNAIREQLRNASLICFVATESSRRTGTMGVQTALRPDGSFHFGGLPTGDATFSFGGPGSFRIIRVERNGVIQPESIDVKQGEDITAVRIVVGYADASIRGTVEIVSGALPPKGQLYVWVKKINDNSPLFRAAQLDARGQFVIDNLNPGTYELVAGVIVQGSRTPISSKRQEVVVTAGSISNVIIKVELNLPKQ